jgi:hypothetical protein
MSLYKIKLNESGSSIMEVMIASSIMTVVILATMSLIDQQNKAVKGISDKVLTKELESQMKSLFADQNYCNCAFRNKRFDLTASPPVLVAADRFSRLKNGYSTGPLDPSPCLQVAEDFIPPVDSSVPNEPSLTIKSLGLDPLVQVSPGVYKADFKVDFGTKSRPLRPIATSVLFSVDLAGGAGPTARPFVSCSSATPVSPITKFKNVQISNVTGLFPRDGSMMVNFSAALPAADISKAVAIQVVGYPLTDVVPTNDTAAIIKFFLDGGMIFNFYSDTSGNNERQQYTFNFLVSPGPHSLSMTSVRTNFLFFRFDIVGYFYNE